MNSDDRLPNSVILSMHLVRGANGLRLDTSSRTLAIIALVAICGAAIGFCLGLLF